MNIQLDIHPSRYFLAFILLTYFGAMLLLLALPLHWWAMLLIEVCLVGSFIHSTRKYIMRRLPETVIKVWVNEHKTWFILRRDGQTLEVKLMNDSMSSQLFVILNFKGLSGTEKGKKFSVVIFSDSVELSAFRRLRAWLHSH
jgi:hypothetical protein